MSPDLQPPEITHLGTTRNEWPVAAFISEEHAKSWAAQKPEDRLLWPVDDIRLDSPLRATRVTEIRLTPKD